MLVLPWADNHFFGEVEGVAINVSTSELNAISAERETCMEAIPDATVVSEVDGATAAP